MKGGSFINIRSLLCLFGLLALTFAAFSPAVADTNGLPPFTVKGKLSVNGVVLTTSNSQYTIKVTDTSGTQFTPIDTEGEPYGGKIAGRFQYTVPLYDANFMTGGAPSGAACIAVYHTAEDADPVQLNVTYPARGGCPEKSGQITIGSPGQSIGFGGIKGYPNDATHTFTNPIKVTIPTLTYTAPAISVKCGDDERNSTTPEAIGTTTVLGNTSTDATCEIGNTGWQTLNLTSVTVSGCGFSLSSAPAKTSLLDNEFTPISLTFTPCGVGTQTGTLTIKSNDPAHGTYTIPLTGKGQGSIELVEGWNLISLPALPSSTDTATILADISTSVAVVFGYAGSSWNYYVPEDAESTLTSMTVGKGYWIYMDNAATLTID